MEMIKYVTTLVTRKQISGWGSGVLPTPPANGREGKETKSVTFHVPGKPQGKARARTVRNRETGRTMTYTPEETVLYENLIKAMYINAARGDGFAKFGKGTPVKLVVRIRYAPPASASKRKREQMLAGEVYPLKKPDIDNIIKVVADALNGIAYHDDAQVMTVNAKKVYSAQEGLDVTVSEYRPGSMTSDGEGS